MPMIYCTHLPGGLDSGRQLCAKGWHVCSPRHQSYLEILTISDVTETPGCYAYNAMNTPFGCERLVNKEFIH